MFSCVFKEDGIWDLIFNWRSRNAGRKFLKYAKGNLFIKFNCRKIWSFVLDEDLFRFADSDSSK